MSVPGRLREQFERDKLAWEKLSPGVREARIREIEAVWPGFRRILEQQP